MRDLKHIAFVCPRYAEGATVGGAETLLRNVAHRAAGAGCRVTFLTTCAQNHFSWENTLPPGVRKSGGIDVHYFPVDTRDAGLYLRIQEAINRRGSVTPDDERVWIDNSVNSQPLYRHLRDHSAEYDRIIMGPYLFGLVWHASQVCPEKTFLVPCLHDEPFAHLTIMKTMFDAVAGCLFNSDPERDLAVRLFDIPDRRRSVVGMGIDPFETNANRFTQAHRIARPYVIYCGRRERGKGVPLLTDYMSAFRRRTGRDIGVVFTGSGPIEAPDDLWPHILDLGFVDEQTKHDALAGALAFVHPSTMESLGIVLLESFLAGTPSLVHAGSEVLHWQCQRSKAGLWFRKYPEFEEELLFLADQPEARRVMGDAGRDFVRREYAWPAVEKRFFDALAHS
jgi:glycosyltransferase involved in cell wall biosynthesis